METASFELNRAIQQWRENLAQSPAFHRENLDELEAHLHDAIPELQKCGLSIEEAYIVAAKRIGTNHSLAPEYAKVNGSSIWLDWILWMLIGAQVYMMLAAVYSIFNVAAVGVSGRLVELIGINQPVYWVFVILLPPLLLSLAVVRAWSHLGRLKGNLQNTFAELLIKPLKFGPYPFSSVSLLQAVCRFHPWVCDLSRFLQ